MADVNADAKHMADLAEAEFNAAKNALEAAKRRVSKAEHQRVETQRALAALSQPVCRGFWWIGQSLEYCDNCGQPAWEHDGMHGYPEGTGPFDLSVAGIVIPWERSSNLFKHYATDQRTGKPFWELMEAKS